MCCPWPRLVCTDMHSSPRPRAHLGMSVGASVGIGLRMGGCRRAQLWIRSLVTRGIIHDHVVKRNVLHRIGVITPQNTW